MDNKLTDKQKELIESLGVIQESMGLSPASSRVDALLTVADNTELSFDDIREALLLSKSATSNAINNLLMLKRIGYKTKLGDRKRYFHTRLGQWKNTLSESIEGLTAYNDVIKEILDNRTTDTKEFNEQLKDLIQFIEYYQKESKQLIENWKNR
ncbi:GbsR/MarR family transcriptional regulator [Winogradskyella bathintestinalis]|uniref:MarR family transcriptional regulator n=1 Tax=Winogradskyella bathintestinalis TaxID=3035208 RepID=A0ABT7ZUR9_9FLAO|nr:MarR family transcriptional regulator [Winogradskyella bathintestinalis]MDN3492718.1 MarR family transcriptional regulator [Winogradskyella bathintestinalis]